MLPGNFLPPRDVLSPGIQWNQAFTCKSEETAAVAGPRPSPRWRSSSCSERRCSAYSAFSRPMLRSERFLISRTTTSATPRRSSWTSRDLSRLSEVYTSDGVLLGKLNERNSQPVPFEDIPDVVKWALLSAEDGGFYDHQGVDFKAIARAALDNVRSGNLIGGSTITQQLVKQNFLTDERTIERKICEAVVAAELERQYTKDQILEFYMNAQFFGANAYGVRAAAQEYWGKDLEDVSIAQAAAMVVPIRNPSFYDLRDNPVGVLARRNDVVDQMADNGFITMAEADEAKQEPLHTIDTESFDQPAPQVLIAAQRELLNDNENRFGLGATFAERKQAIFGCPANDAGCEGGGGLRVFVTVDFAMQEEANRILRDWFRYDDSPLEPSAWSTIAPERSRWSLQASSSARTLKRASGPTTSPGMAPARQGRHSSRSVC